MINEVDETLRSLFKNEVLRGTDVDVVFEAPTREWATRRNKPTVNLFLYDIREDTRRMLMGDAEIRDERGHVTARVPPPRYFKLAYLVTAWTQRPEDEHRLLSAALASIINYPYLRDEHKTDLLKENGVPLQIRIAFPPPEDRQVSDVWTSLGGDLKPSLDLQVELPISAAAMEDIANAVLAPLKLTSSAFNTMEGDDGTRQLRPSEAEQPVA